ncbi:MAG: polysaccharide deacetylase family protein [Bacteroidales bacterium]
MMLVSSPYILQKVSPGALKWKVPTPDKKIFLTFDDGPFPGVTDNILQLLDTYNAKATFFCTGRQAQKHPGVINIIKDEGHSLGNHTFNHVSGWGNSVKEYMDDINLCDDVFQSNLFRPPYGRITPAQIRALKKRFSIVMWSHLTHDYKKESIPEKKIAALKKRIASGSIVLLHDSEKAAKNVTVVLEKLLVYFSGQEYSFCNLEKVFTLPETN